MSQTSLRGFTHEYHPGRSGRTLLLLHGTGGNERDLLPLGRELDPEANLLSPLGKILEHGAIPRFFRRLAEGVFDLEDLVHRTHELADFTTAAAVAYGFDPGRLLAVGYSNGANIAAAMLLLRPEALAGAALLRAMLPLEPETLPPLTGTPVLIATGNHDQMIPTESSRRLIEVLRQAGAEVTAHFEEAGHGLTSQTVATARNWLLSLQPPASK